MSTPLNQKSTVQQIRDRFDSDVDRFTQLETGQGSTMDAPLAMQLITDAAVACTKPIHRVLDIGCGAGNNTIKLRQVLGEDFELMWNRYGDYLIGLGGQQLKDKVFRYIDREDSPRPVTYQLELLRQVGFARVELLHKNACFAAFGAMKDSE